MKGKLSQLEKCDLRCLEVSRYEVFLWEISLWKFSPKGNFAIRHSRRKSVSPQGNFIVGNFAVRIFRRTEISPFNEY